MCGYLWKTMWPQLATKRCKKQHKNKSPFGSKLPGSAQKTTRNADAAAL
jgi:hypothetical protein